MRREVAPLSELMAALLKSGKTAPAALSEKWPSGVVEAAAERLGLSIAQRIVEQHRGRIRVGNREGGGAVLTVELPCVSGRAA